MPIIWVEAKPDPILLAVITVSGSISENIKRIRIHLMAFRLPSWEIKKKDTPYLNFFVIHEPIYRLYICAHVHPSR